MAQQIKIKLQIYNWKNNFLSEHSQHSKALLEGKMFTPELMVASDINSQQIRHLYQKMLNCHNTNQCYNKIYQSEDIKDLIRPPIVDMKLIKDEL